MNPWIAKAVILAASIALIAIRAPHGQRSAAGRERRRRGTIARMQSTARAVAERATSVGTSGR